MANSAAYSEEHGNANYRSVFLDELAMECPAVVAEDFVEAAWASKAQPDKERGGVGYACRDARQKKQHKRRSNLAELVTCLSTMMP